MKKYKQTIEKEHRLFDIYNDVQKQKLKSRKKHKNKK